MEGFNNVLTSSYHHHNQQQQDFRYLFENELQYGENGYSRLIERNPQCCNEPLHLKPQIPTRRHSQFPQLQPLVNLNNTPRCPSPPTTSVSMERTPSGHSILSGTTLSVSSEDETNTLSDSAAAKEMITSFRRRRRHLFEERVLESLLRRRPTHKLDNQALDSLLCAVDKVFFHNSLAGRVRWEWSHPDSKRYEHELIGTTALRKAKDRPGYETLIVLSRPMLWSGRYDHRLLLSTFLHEAVHCYLFVRCGFKAVRCGGHTEGFTAIARVIDRWADGALLLGGVKADLRAFSVGEENSNLNLNLNLNSASASASSLFSFPDSQPNTPSDSTETTNRPLPNPEQRVTRSDRARYMRAAAEMSSEMSYFNFKPHSNLYSHSPSQQEPDENRGGWNGDGSRGHGWSSFVAFTGGASPG